MHANEACRDDGGRICQDRSARDAQPGGQRQRANAQPPPVPAGVR
jgi:hypothetical protein